MRHRGTSGHRLETYRVVFSRDERSLAAVGKSEWIGGLRDYTVGVEMNELLGDELDPVVFVLIFGGVSPRSCGISIRTRRRCYSNYRPAVNTLPPPGKFPLGLEKFHTEDPSPGKFSDLRGLLPLHLVVGQGILRITIPLSGFFGEIHRGNGTLLLVNPVDPDKIYSRNMNVPVGSIRA